jgi:hypothetical protein
LGGVVAGAAWSMPRVVSFAPASAGTPGPTEPSADRDPDIEPFTTDPFTTDPFDRDPSPSVLSLALTGADITTLTTVGVASVAAGAALCRAARRQSFTSTITSR